MLSDNEVKVIEAVIQRYRENMETHKENVALVKQLATEVNSLEKKLKA